MTVGAPLTITGTGSGTLTIPSGNSIGLGSRSLTIDTDSFLISISATITGATGSGGSIIKNGANTLILGSTTNTFAGGVTLNNGNLNLNVDSNVFTAGVLNRGALGIGT